MRPPGNASAHDGGQRLPGALEHLDAKPYNRIDHGGNREYHRGRVFVRRRLRAPEQRQHQRFGVDLRFSAGT